MSVWQYVGSPQGPKLGPFLWLIERFEADGFGCLKYTDGTTV